MRLTNTVKGLCTAALFSVLLLSCTTLESILPTRPSAENPPEPNTRRGGDSGTNAKSDAEILEEARRYEEEEATRQRARREAEERRRAQQQAEQRRRATETASSYPSQRSSSGSAPPPPASMLEPMDDTAPISSVGALMDDRLYNSIQLPKFPWPPETPSSRMSLPREGILARDSELSLADVEYLLSVALSNAGYYEQSLYSVPGGFALVTRLKGIDDKGNPLGEEMRYKLPKDEKPFSLTSFVSDLFFAPEGHYRFVAFVISNTPFRASTETLSETAALTRLQEGASALPKSFDKRPFTNAHNVDAMVYEYQINATQSNAELILPGRLSPKTHLVKSGLASSFNNLLKVSSGLE